jgi:hypothetical protein
MTRGLETELKPFFTILGTRMRARTGEATLFAGLDLPLSVALADHSFKLFFCHELWLLQITR